MPRPTASRAPARRPRASPGSLATPAPTPLRRLHQNRRPARSRHVQLPHQDRARLVASVRIFRIFRVASGRARLVRALERADAFARVDPRGRASRVTPPSHIIATIYSIRRRLHTISPPELYAHTNKSRSRTAPRAASIARARVIDSRPFTARATPHPRSSPHRPSTSKEPKTFSQCPPPPP